MEYEWNDERQRYITSRGKVILNACPGSGKTTSVAYKIKTILETWNKKYAGIACLSFTNIAKDEINNKFLEFTGQAMKFPHIVSTIDSFINNYITIPHFDLLGFGQKAVIIEDFSVLNNFGLQRYKLGNRPMQYIYPPSKIDITLDGNYLYDGKTPNLTDREIAIFNRYCTEIKRIQFSRGLLKNADSTYLAYKILNENPQIARLLSLRFPYIIIDEAQDTSDVQYKIIDLLIQNGLQNIELIGDPYQSLYEWREARPDLFMERTTLADWNSLQLTKCKRSLQPIVDAYSLFRIDVHKNIVGQALSHEDFSPIQLIYYSNFNNLLSTYESLSSTYHNKRVLVRGTTHLNQLNASMEVTDYWRDSPFSLLNFIYAKADLDKGKTKNAINRIYKLLPYLYDTSLKDNPIRRKEFIEKYYNNYEIKSRLLKLISSSPDYEKSLVEWTEEYNELCKRILGLDAMPLFELKAGNYRKYHQKSLNQLLQVPSNLDRVSTIHSVKGQTFDSVMLILSRNSSGQNISLNDFVSQSIMPDEKKRLIYVAMSRPMWQLVIATPIENRLNNDQVKFLFGDRVTVYEI